MIRLVPDQSGEISRSAPVTIRFDGEAVPAHAGEMVLGALMRAGLLHLRDAPRGRRPRGAFCCMGLCQECLVEVDGQRVESCRQVVADGLVVQSLKQNPDG